MDVTIADEGLQILTYAWHSWSLSSENSLISVTYLLWDGTSIYKVNSRTRDTQTYCQAFSSGAPTYCFYDLRVPRLGFEHPTFRLWVERSNLMRTAAVFDGMEVVG